MYNALSTRTVSDGHRIELYFQRIQVFLPLFHRPRFEQYYLERNNETRYINLTIDRAYMFYGMLALSARFSSSSYFGGMNPKERGSQFARQAQAIYHKMIQDSIPHSTSLVWLQGHILLAYYNQACRPALGCDLMVATCIRFAYDLGLHRIDEDEPDSVDSEQWVRKEGQRRAWWCIWELDAFDSISSRRPFTINWNRVFVFLPVSDEAWFSNTPVRSAMLSSDLLQCWKALRDSPNQDERAWFLISNFILAQALELCQQRHVSLKSINDIETVVSCFSLLFHEKFRCGVKNPLLDDNTCSKSNWSTLTRLMVQSYVQHFKILLSLF
ncbi:hypothetical protein OIDMADRAFT_137263 [Oidiodendron maius Zn]|uniref:Xylanolytic transcriptional activator regulatory domain-containing protein n=1 Tax=Oidiodendron maius (strain Zn) TaxID=913774 RepID=A0A0C3GQL6_OIDMZ|nr:hypothetical protein OIDMADRAFT_137263 [Oidiodendron maius Zn]